MDPLDKLEIVVKHQLAEKKKKRTNSNWHSSELYILELDSEIGMLEKVKSEIDAIKRNHYLTTDEMVSKLYSSG